MSLPFRAAAYLVATLSGASLGYSISGGVGDGAVSRNTMPSTLPVGTPPVTPVATPETMSDGPPPTTVQTTAAPDGDTVDTSGWTLRSEVSDFDNLTNVFLSVSSDRPLPCGPRRRATLMLRCLQDRTAVYIAHDCATPPGDPDGWQVEQRLDTAAATTAYMEVDSHGEAFGYWQYRPARTLIENLIRADNLHLRFTDADGLTSEMRFPLTGLTEALPTLSAACNWSDVAPWEAPDPAAITVGSEHDPHTGESGVTTSAGKSRDDHGDDGSALNGINAISGDHPSTAAEGAASRGIGPGAAPQAAKNDGGDQPGPARSPSSLLAARSGAGASINIVHLVAQPPDRAAGRHEGDGGTDPQASTPVVVTVNASNRSRERPADVESAPRLLLGERWLNDYTRGIPPKK